ncbi:MAG: hypothetical protein R3246_12615, partial [Acidimicrobiia bacterium]|nr:hypothetical protein [Acidimicrobiia bacterium]
MAAGAGIQVGTVRYPYDDIYMTMPWVSEGDTVLLGPGVNLMDFNPDVTQTWFDVGVVVMGDTTGGQPRPVLRAPSVCCQTLYWQGGGRTEIRNLEFDGLYWAVEVDFLDYLLVDNVVVRKRPGTRYGIVVNNFVDTVSITDTQIYGDSAGFNAFVGVSLNSGHLAEMRDVVVDGWRSVGIELRSVDSSDILRANITGPGFGLMANATNRPNVAVRMRDSRIETTDDPALATRTRTWVSERNVLRPLGANRIPLEVDGPTGTNITGVRTLRSVGDSIFYVGTSFWSYFSGMDSLWIDSLWYEHEVDSLTSADQYMQADYAVITNSHFRRLNHDGIQ